MLSNIYVFIISIPAHYRDQENGSMFKQMFSETPFIVTYDEGLAYLLHFQYFTSLSEAVIKLSRFADEYSDIVTIVDVGKHSTAIFILEIANRRGYLYDVNSALGFFYNEKIENSFTNNNAEL